MSWSAKPAPRSASTACDVTSSLSNARTTWSTGLRIGAWRMSSLVNRFAVMSLLRGIANASVRQQRRTGSALVSFATLQPGEQLADEAAPERDHADDEDRADDHRDPLADAVGEQVLQADDRERTDHRPGERAHAAEQRHQHDLAGDRPVRVGERGEAEHDRLQRAGEAGDRGRKDEREQLVPVDVVAERD